MRSPLTDYVHPSPNCNPRNGTPIVKITPHHVAGVATVEGLGEGFAKVERQGSANYGIGIDGRIGCYVDEEYRAWTSSNADNDYQAITIEVSNSEVGGDWPISDLCFDRLVELCVDICKRHNIERLIYTGDERGNLTMHKFFAPTACPGPYLEARFPLLAERVNDILMEDKEMTSAEKYEFNELKKLVNKQASKIEEQEEEIDKLKDQVGIKWAYVDKNLPDWATPTIKKLVKKGALKGNGNNSLELNYLILRILVILDREGVFGE